MRWLNSITDSMDMGLGELWGLLKDREVWYATVHGITKSRTWLSKSTDLIIFTIIILNSFSSSLLISSSFIWISVFLVCSFICAVFLPFHYFFKHCVWGLLSSGFKVEFFLPFGFCPPNFVPGVSVSFIYGDICSELLCVCFFLFFLTRLWWAGLCEVLILCADDWICIFVLFVVWVRSLAQGATGGWVMPGLVFKLFP